MNMTIEQVVALGGYFNEETGDCYIVDSDGCLERVYIRGLYQTKAALEAADVAESE